MRVLILLCASLPAAHAQQPFLTDDTGVAQTHHLHLELMTEHDWLQKEAYPTLRQNTTRVQLTYGLLDRVEIGFDTPLLSIYNDHRIGTPNAFGFGDLDLQLKCNLRTERPDSRWPAFSLGLFVELPTGNPANQLGSGLADYWLNGIVQKALSDRLTLHLNSGILFSGNTLTGAIGIRSSRGSVFTGSSSLTYKLNDKWLMGAELAGALTNKFDLGKGQLQSLVGATYSFRKAIGLNLALTGGKFEGSPRLGGSVGVSVDF